MSWIVRALEYMGFSPLQSKVVEAEKLLAVRRLYNDRAFSCTVTVLRRYLPRLVRSEIFVHGIGQPQR